MRSVAAGRLCWRATAQQFRRRPQSRGNILVVAARQHGRQPFTASISSSSQARTSAVLLVMHLQLPSMLKYKSKLGRHHHHGSSGMRSMAGQCSFTVSRLMVLLTVAGSRQKMGNWVNQVAWRNGDGCRHQHANLQFGDGRGGVRSLARSLLRRKRINRLATDKTPTPLAFIWRRRDAEDARNNG